MVIKVTETIVLNTRGATFETELSSREAMFTKAYGDPQVDVGGSIAYTDTASAPQTVVLPSKLIGLRTGFPATQVFDGTTDIEAANKLAGWITVVTARITTAKSTLMAKPTPVTPKVTITEV